MKKQLNPNWICQTLIIAIFILTAVAQKALADGNSCANPFELALEGQVKMKFCEIPAAQGVLIGSENGDDDQRPVKARNFQRFQMAQFDVTQLQYKTVTGLAPWRKDAGIPEENDQPALYISFYDAQSFARILNLIDKTATYRLPTEAEFEYAARAGTTTNYYWGDEIDANFAYFGESIFFGYKTRKVDSCPNEILNSKYPGYCANNFGLYNMLGNVWKWVGDAYGSYENVATNGNVAVRGEVDSPRVVRGGSVYAGRESLCSSSRGHLKAYKSDFLTGFRLVRIAK